MCELCHGINSHLCPNCGGKNIQVCTRCNGAGKIFFAYNRLTNDSEEVSEEFFESLPEDEEVAERLGIPYCKGDVENCRQCDGTGEVEEDEDGFDEMAAEEKYYTKKYGN